MKTFTNDHRVRVTKMLIRKAFTGLLEKKPIQSISIKELCELAGINRSTFYAHYTDVYDLRSKMQQEMLADFNKAMRPLLEQKDNPVGITAGIFQCLKDNSDLCIATLGDFGDKQFLMQLLSIGRDACLQSYAAYFAQASPKKIEYFYAFVSAGCIGLLQKWLADSMAAPAEELAHAAEQIMLQGVGFLQ